MKALTVRQPWADSIAFGKKRTENRSRVTHYRGLLLIHAGLKTDPAGRGEADWPGARGAVIAVTELVGCHRATDGCCGEWGRPDGWHWELGDVLPLRHAVPAPGRLGLWTPDAELVRAVEAAL